MSSEDNALNEPGPSKQPRFDIHPNLSGCSPKNCKVGADRMSEDDIESSANTRKTMGRQRIPIKFISDRDKRISSFSKRKYGLMKKAFELAELTGSEILLLIASETNHVYTFTTNGFKSVLESDTGKNLIASSLNNNRNRNTEVNDEVLNGSHNVSGGPLESSSNCPFSPDNIKLEIMSESPSDEGIAKCQNNSTHPSPKIYPENLTNSSSVPSESANEFIINLSCENKHVGVLSDSNE